ncbi:MAG: hypothetical protein EXX96DRAFT_579583 [Benjaminiella poitrasii]|nr:MAG: hypothetical protein EXX96DRAFT_579583 [Benjaminiella poitrasii]
MNPAFIINTVPATCELCGNWLPGHSSACPRNGVHPSQWKNFDIFMDKDEFGKAGHNYSHVTFPTDANINEEVAFQLGNGC